MHMSSLPWLAAFVSVIILPARGLAGEGTEPFALKRAYPRAGSRPAAKPASTRANPARAPQGTNIVLNGGFEANGGVGTNIFTNWTVESLFGGTGDWLVQTGTASPLNGFPVEAPPEGSFAAMTDQTGPGTHVLHQVLAVPAAPAVILTCHVYVNNQAGAYFTPATLDFNGAPNQQARIDIMNPAAPIDDVGAGVLLNMFITNPGAPAVIPYTTVTANLTPFAGTNVRLRVAEVDNQLFMNVGVDDCSTADVPVELMGFSVE